MKAGTWKKWRTKITNDKFIDRLIATAICCPLDCSDIMEHARKLIAESIPIKSHHCTTTHSACDCVLERLKKLEKVAEAAKCAYYVTEDEDEGEGDGLYIGWEDLMALGKALKELEGE